MRRVVSLPLPDGRPLFLIVWDFATDGAYELLSRIPYLAGTTIH